MAVTHSTKDTAANKNTGESTMFNIVSESAVNSNTKNTAANSNTQNYARNMLTLKSNRKVTLDIISSKNTLESQKSFFSRHRRSDTTTIIQVNSGYIHMLANILCSIERLGEPSAEFIRSIVLWTSDKAFANALIAYLAASPHDKYSRIGIYQSADIGVDKYQAAGNTEYAKLMRTRGKFFVHLLENIKTDFLFLDGDIVFFQDPFPWIVENKGRGLQIFGDIRYSPLFNISEYNRAEKLTGNDWGWLDSIDVSPLDREKNQMQWDIYTGQYNHPPPAMENDVLLDVDPDLVYSTDPRQTHAYLDDPFEGNNRVPKICGGTFYVKTNSRTISLFNALLEKIASGSGNDQYSMDQLLNDQSKDVVMVGKVPRCIPRFKGDPVFCPEMRKVDPDIKVTVRQLPLDNQVLRVRILDHTQFPQGAITHAAKKNLEAINKYHDLLTKPMFPTKQINRKSVTYRIAVAYHMNIWNGDKKAAMEKFGMWYLDENGYCKV